MDYYLLTDLTARVGCHLALSGAETFRVEETMRRIIGAYGIDCQAFAIPNCVMVSLEAANGKPLMVMKRVGFHGNDLEGVEKLNALSRRICAESIPCRSIISAICSRRRASALFSAARCATAPGGR